MKTVTALLMLMLALSVFAEEKKAKTDPRAFRMPRVAPVSDRPAVPERSDEPTSRPVVESTSRPVVESTRGEAAKSVETDGAPETRMTPESDSTTRRLDDSSTPAPPAAQSRSETGAPRATGFTLPGQTPVPAAKKKTPPKFQLPRKKQN